MTILGKGLVLLNLVMSVIFLGFAVHVYSSAGDVQQQNKKLKESVQVEQNKALTFEQTATNYKKERDEQKARDEINIKNLNGTVDELNKQLTSLKDDIQKSREQQAQTATSNNLSAQSAIERQKEVMDLRKIRDEQIKQNTILMEKLTQLQDDNSKIRNERDLVNGRNQQLVTNVKMLENWIAAHNNGRIPTDGELADSTRLSPVPDVEGVVTKVESEGKLVTLSIGEDDGLRKGHILQIWREKPVSQYIGQLMIVETKGRVSVAKPVSAVSGVIKENDKVSPRIMKAQ